MCHGHTKHRLGQSMDDKAMTDKATNVEPGNDEARNSRSWERQDEELKTLGTTQENEDRDKDQGDKMG